MTLKEKYIAEHSEWLDHYVVGDYRGLFLAFKKDFMEREMPKKTLSGLDEVTVKLLDTEDDNKVYHMGWWLNYENDYPYHSCILDKDFNDVNEYLTLHMYIYGSKLCPCNIKAGAQRDGAITDDECEGSRFLIESITFDDHPDLILYSNFYDKEKLENLLEGT